MRQESARVTELKQKTPSNPPKPSFLRKKTVKKVLRQYAKAVRSLACPGGKFTCIPQASWLNVKRKQLI
ncbi:MAG: hypothetical protein CMK07_12750 [Ponticaulis sp.]|nr:hypothetical protein [Ponticaulis sp.]